MNNLQIAQTSKTPLVSFSTNGELTIEGRSLPEDSIVFYNPCLQWLDELSKSLPREIKFKVKLEYFNTASSKMLISIFKKLENIKDRNVDITIIWHYDEDDEDTKEAGEDFDSLVRLPFKHIMVM